MSVLLDVLQIHALACFDFPPGVEVRSSWKGYWGLSKNRSRSKGYIVSVGMESGRGVVTCKRTDDPGLARGNVWRDNIADLTPNYHFYPNPIYPNDIHLRRECTTMRRALQAVQTRWRTLSAVYGCTLL